MAHGNCPAQYRLDGPEVLAVTPAGCGGSSALGTVGVNTVDTSGATNSTLFYVRLFEQIVR